MPDQAPAEQVRAEAIERLSRWHRDRDVARGGGHEDHWADLPEHRRATYRAAVGPMVDAIADLLRSDLALTNAAKISSPESSSAGPFDAPPPESRSESGMACQGYQWLGQSFAHCDRCGQPYWHHTHEERLRDGCWVLEPVNTRLAETARRQSEVRDA